MQFVYVLRSQKDNKLYIGCTHNIDERLKTHNKGLVRSTKTRIPFALIYKESYTEKYKAFLKEKFYKTIKGRKELEVKLNNCGIV